MPPQGGQCPFCQLIDNPQQLMTVGETDNFYAWLEVNPRAKGHTMVVPKEHKENVLEFSMDEWQEAFKLTREVVEKAKKGLDADGVSITVNIEEAGGQMLPHAYIQVFPRFQDDENAGTPTGAIFPQQEELQNQLDSIQDSMSSASVDIGETREAHPESQNFKDESEIDKILDDSPLDEASLEAGGEDEEEAHRKRKNVRGENPGTGETNERYNDQPEQQGQQDQRAEETRNNQEANMSPRKMLSRLVESYGSPEKLIQSDEFQRILSQANMRIEEKREFSGNQSIDWR